MVAMAGLDIPLRAVRQQLAAAIDVIIHTNRLAGGSRKIVSITEVLGMEGDVITMQELFAYEQLGISERGEARGRFVGRGVTPAFTERLMPTDREVGATLFKAQVLLEDDLDEA